MVGFIVVAKFVVVTLVARLMEIGFYMQNQTLKIILRHIFHKADKQLKIFYVIFLYVKHFHLKIFYTLKIFYILPNTAKREKKGEREIERDTETM